MGNVSGLGARSIGACIPESFKQIGAVLGMSVDAERDLITFSFGREKRDGVWGWATRLHVGKLKICAPWVEGLPFPRRRAEAETWVVDFCARIGIAPMLNVGHDGNPERKPGARAEAAAKRRRAAFRVLPGSGRASEPQTTDSTTDNAE